MRTEKRFNEIKYTSLLPRYFPPRIMGDIKSFENSFPDLPDIDFEDGVGLYLWGEVRAGKTLFAAHIMISQIKKQWLTPSDEKKSFKFLNTPELFFNLRRAYNTEDKAVTEWSVLEQYLNPWMLIMDDIAPFGKQSDWMLSMFYFLINSRIEKNRPTIYTSNLDLEELSNLLDDRITDRIQRSCVVAKKQHWDNGG